MMIHVCDGCGRVLAGFLFDAKGATTFSAGAGVSTGVAGAAW